MKKNSSGMTLVEILMALAILALLMTATMRLLVRLPQNGEALEKKLSQRQWQTSVCDLIERDLWHASKCTQTPKGLQLETVSSIHAESMVFSHSPTTVEYACKTLNGESWLYRQETLKGQSPQKQWVCQGVTQVTSQEETPDSPQAQTQKFLVLEFSDPAQRPLQIPWRLGP